MEGLGGGCSMRRGRGLPIGAGGNLGLPVEVPRAVRSSDPVMGLKKRPGWLPDSQCSGPHRKLQVKTQSLRGRCQPRGHSAQPARLQPSQLMGTWLAPGRRDRREDEQRANR